MFPRSLVWVALFALSTALTRHSGRWHYTRISQRGGLTRAQRFNAPNGLPFEIRGANAPVYIYVVDSGVRASHEEFRGRVILGPDLIGDRTKPGFDCQGHGTSVAALAAGSYSGIARNATIVSVRTLDCYGDGHCVGVVDALKWIRNDAIKRAPARAVVVMALGSRHDSCQVTVKHTKALAMDGLVVVAASGNGKRDSCEVFPARNKDTIAVAATDEHDRLYEMNNHGSCIDIAAPGVGVIAAWGNGTDATYRYVSGTSMATPLVAGVAALMLSADPTLTRDEVHRILVSSATRMAVKTRKGRLALNLPNRMLFAPWDKLFDEVPRETTPLLYDEINMVWLLIRAKFFPRVQPAMMHSAHKITGAVIKAANVNRHHVVLHRPQGMARLENGTEPNEVRLHIYVKATGANQSRLIRAMESGNLTRIIREKIYFVRSSSGRLLVGVSNLPKSVSEPLEVTSSWPSPITIMLSVLLGWMLLMFVIVVGTITWKKKWSFKKTVHPPSSNSDPDHSIVVICGTDNGIESKYVGEKERKGRCSTG